MRHRLQDSGHIKERSSLPSGQRVAKGHEIKGLTDASSATPVQSLLSSNPRKRKMPYDTSAANGVDALKYRRYRLHSVRVSAVVSKDVVKANAVGAKDDESA